MLKNKILFLIFFLIVLTSFVSALELNDDDIYFDFDDSSNPINDRTSTYYFTHNKPINKFQKYGLPSYSIYSIYFNETYQSKAYSSSNLVDKFNEIINDSWEVSIWVNSSFDTDKTQYIIYFRYSSAEGFGVLVQGESDRYYIYFITTGGAVTLTSVGFDPYDKIHMISVGWNETHYYAFINDSTTLTDSSAKTNKLVDVTTLSSLYLGASWEDEAVMIGNLDELVIFNRSLTYAERTDLFDNGISSLLTTDPVWVSPSVDGQTFNTNITVNISHSGIDINFSLYLDDVIIFYNVSGRLGTTGSYLNWTTNVSDGTYVLKASVFNFTSGDWSNNITRTFTIDTQTPTLTLDITNSFNGSNVSLINQYADYLYFNITAIDETDLFGFLINVTRRGVSYFNFTNETLSGHTTFNYSDNRSTSTWPSGVYNIEIVASDSSTIGAIDDYGISQFLGRIRFDTPEGNRIDIIGTTTSTTNYLKKVDRYEFGWDFLFKDTKRTFTIKANNKIHYLPNSPHKPHFVVIGNDFNGNWITFNIGNDYSVKKISDREYEITFVNLPLSNKIITKSIGGINKVTKNYKWYKGNYTITSPDSTAYGDTELFVLNLSSNSSYVNLSASFQYDNVLYSTTSTFNSDYTAFSTTITIPQPDEIYENVSFFWSVNVTQQDNSLYSFNVEDSLNVSDSLIDDCSVGEFPILNISGKDEETDVEVDLSLNIYIFSSASESGLINSSFELSGSPSYLICARENYTQYSIDAIMEYGDETYTDRKYYLNDFTINTSIVPEVFLYHLNDTKASEIVFTVFDTTTGDRVSGAFIEILRYYPGENVFRVVEIAKTDETGQSLGKMVLADVFYKFIIESPAGTVKLSTDILRILSLTRSFGISFVTDVLDTWDKIHGVSTSVTCTKGTQTCRITWSDESNIVRDATLEVWRTTGLADTLLSTQTTTAAAGTISYTITESTDGRAYTAKGFIESSTGTSLYGVGIAGLIFSDNPFFTDETHRLASLFPLFLLVVVIIFTLIDFGVIGIVIGSLLGMIIGSIIGILPIDPFYLISFILMAILLIYKLSK